MKSHATNKWNVNKKLRPQKPKKVIVIHVFIIIRSPHIGAPTVVVSKRLLPQRVYRYSNLTVWARILPLSLNATDTCKVRTDASRIISTCYECYLREIKKSDEQQNRSSQKRINSKMSLRLIVWIFEERGFENVKRGQPWGVKTAAKKEKRLRVWCS